MGHMNTTVGILGAGSMGGSIARGLVASGTLEASNIWVCDPDPRCTEPLEQMGIHVAADADDLVDKNTEVTILAVKPQILADVAGPLAGGLANRLVVSIAAGVPLSALEELLDEAHVVRVMPNLPIQVLSGATAVTAGSRASEGETSLVRELFGSLGTAQVMREDQLDAEGAVVSCGPAYVALFVDALTRAGVRAGLPAAACREMVATTMRGVAQMLLQSGEHPRAYMERVTSPGGTTAAGLYAMEPLVIDAAYDAVDAALERTAELAEG